MEAAKETDALANENGRRYTTISIPQPLYQEIKKAIQGTGFRSPTEYLVYVTRLSLQGPILKDGQPAAPATTERRESDPFGWMRLRGPFQARG